MNEYNEWEEIAIFDAYPLLYEKRFGANAPKCALIRGLTHLDNWCKSLSFRIPHIQHKRLDTFLSAVLAILSISICN
jgi:hypothetical protein